MKTWFKRLVNIPLFFALFAALFGLVQAPLTASAMHVSMDAELEVSSTPHGLMGGHDSHQASSSDCEGSSCEQRSNCLEHCLDQADSQDAQVAMKQSSGNYVPTVLTRRIVYPDKGEPDRYNRSDGYYPSKRSVVLTTQKRE